jgi:hypothetical protein
MKKSLQRQEARERLENLLHDIQEHRYNISLKTRKINRLVTGIRDILRDRDKRDFRNHRSDFNHWLSGDLATLRESAAHVVEIIELLSATIDQTESKDRGESD